MVVNSHVIEIAGEVADIAIRVRDRAPRSGSDADSELRPGGIGIRNRVRVLCHDGPIEIEARPRRIGHGCKMDPASRRRITRRQESVHVAM